MNATTQRTRLGELLRARMQQCRIPQCELAKSLGISPAAVSQMLSGRRSFRRSLLIRTCDLLRMTPMERKELLQLLDIIRSGDQRPAGEKTYPPAAPVVEDVVAEPVVPYRMEPRRLPVLPAAKLAGWAEDEPLQEFALRHTTTTVPVLTDYPAACIFIEGSGREFGINFHGRVRLIASESRPSGFREMELVYLRPGGFRIRERVGGVWRHFRIGGTPAPSLPQQPRRVLRLPILELMLLPQMTGRRHGQ